MALMLQYPKLPNKLTECFVGELIADGTLLRSTSPISVSAGGGGDLIVRHASGARTIEVKGTAQGFTMFSAKDLVADFLVWVDFGAYFRSDRTVAIHVVEKLGRIGIPGNTKMTLREFLTLTEAFRDSFAYDWSGF